MSANLLYKAVFITTLLLMIGCDKPQQLIKNQGTVFGSTYSIQYLSDKDYHQEIQQIFTEFNQAVSTYQTDSDVVRFNLATDSIQVQSAILPNLIQLSKTYHQATNGYFDPTVMPLIELWDANKNTNASKPSDTIIANIVEFVSMDLVDVKDSFIIKKDKRVKLNFNSVTGYSNDMVAAFLESKSIHHYLIEIGGELIAKGNKPNNQSWIVGIDKPQNNKRELQAKLKLDNAALATSGNYRKFWVNQQGEKFVHTINPNNGKATESDLLSATIVSPSCAQADAYATAIMAMGKDKAEEFLNKNTNIKAYLLISNGKTYQVKTYNDFDVLLNP